jgi:CO/xanthine dehydrogenase Mo-binding subunit
VRQPPDRVPARAEAARTQHHRPEAPPLGADSSNTEAGTCRTRTASEEHPSRSHTVDSAVLHRPAPVAGPHPEHVRQRGFIDELAAAEADPVEFRLRYIGDPRLADSLKAAAEAAGWREAVAEARDAEQPRDRSRSLRHAVRGSDGYAATVVDVEVNKRTGKVRGDPGRGVHDVGIIINPNGLRAQIEGNVVHGVSRSLKEEVQLNRRASASRDWETYQVMRFTEMPQVRSC